MPTVAQQYQRLVWMQLPCSSHYCKRCWCDVTCTCVQEVEAALQGSAGVASKQLRQLHGRCMLQLEDLVEVIRGPLSDLERMVCDVTHVCNTAVMCSLWFVLAMLEGTTWIIPPLKLNFHRSRICLPRPARIRPHASRVVCVVE